ncbi:Nucleoporin NUP84 [Cercospora beticola]|uniref:Nuclear pore complex protein n=1 Tax=Cercospora beticola TaxID=122368 RepID=A0A2G5I9I2_CERBT|nr:Nucleoporin NUP84 [Cercospora beticola]PIB01455.1 Nucleoporin NUP84 [Cercospora beticola]WPA96807.1 hypothetical protein RHO25_001415 [Cercospora beticola]CAK1354823.1 unnamed protein product [Cercospora beticola]
MPPSTRSRAQAGPVKKAPARKSRTTRSNKPASDSWELLAPAESDIDSEHDNVATAIEQRQQPGAAAMPRSESPLDLGLRDASDSLREMAERVGKEVETFAERLDEFLDSLPKSDTYEAVLGLVDEYQSIAKDAAYKLDAEHRRDRAHVLRQEWSETAQVASAAPTNALAAPAYLSSAESIGAARREKVVQQRKWQQEADIWDLFRLMLELHHNPDKRAQKRERESRLADLGNVHRYTSEAELWDRFLLTDDVASERDLVRRWLEQTVEHQASDVTGIAEELENKAGRGKGLWSHGWTHTRETIKHEKRLRAWPEPDALPLPTLRRKDNNEALVTSLDPDAASRQNRALEQADAFAERALWITCWEMLRRGRSWQEVSEWCEQHHEPWRASVIGKSSDPTDVTSNAVWRRMCYLASQSDSCSDFEAAVYGLLGGSVHAMRKVCRTLDDHLYANYSSYLVRQFDRYLVNNYPDRTPFARQGAIEEELQDPDQIIYDLLHRLRKEPGVADEAVLPMKIIESYLIANDVGSLVHTMGFAIAYADKQLHSSEQMIVHLEPFWEDKSSNQPEMEVALDPQTLRIASHMGILLDTLSPQQLDWEALSAKENTIVAYIQTLRSAGKRDLIPVYASRLSKGAYVATMSRVLQDIAEEKEQRGTLNLLEQYGLDVIFILNEQLGYMLDQHLANDLGKREKPLKMLEASKEPHHPNQRIINGFVPEYHTEDDRAIAASLRWFNIIDGHWDKTFGNLSLALRKALIAGRLGCAFLIVAEFPYENLAIRKSYQVIGKSINPMDLEHTPPADEATTWDLLIRQSRTYYELELLMNAIQALASWRAEEEAYTQKKPKLSGASPTLKASKEAVDEAMLPILQGNLLLSPIDEAEEADLALIRKWYIPELILAYNAVHHAAGYMISRDNLIKSMDLSVIVADDRYHLAEAFVAAGRMRELVESFACTSRSMLVLKAEGKKWNNRKGREGKDLGIWEAQSTASISPERDLALS